MAEKWAPGIPDTFLTNQYYDRFYADSFIGQSTLYQFRQKEKKPTRSVGFSTPRSN